MKTKIILIALLAGFVFLGSGCAVGPSLCALALEAKPLPVTGK